MSQTRRYKQKKKRIYPPSPIPKKIIDYLQKNPGAQIYKIVESTGASRGAVTYHLTALIEHGQILTDNQSAKKHYYLPSQSRKEKETDLQRFMKSECKELILTCLLQTPGLSRTEIAAAIQKNGTSLYRHLDSMYGAGVIDRTRVGHSWNYTLSKETERSIRKELDKE